MKALKNVYEIYFFTSVIDMYKQHFLSLQLQYLWLTGDIKLFFFMN